MSKTSQKLVDNLPQNIESPISPEDLLNFAEEMPEQQRTNALVPYAEVLNKLKFEKFMSTPNIAKYMTRAGIECKPSTVANFFRSQAKAKESEE